MNLLDECCCNHHKFFNFSLIQAVGNLQGIKGKDKEFDRLDSFVSLLSKYLGKGDITHIRNIGLLTEGMKINDYGKTALRSYLESFSSIYDYCSCIYFIDDKSFVDRIIREGNEPLDRPEHVVRYMKLAKDFWNEKLKNWALIEVGQAF